LVIVLVLFGGSKLPEIARSLGKSMHEFKKGINEGASEKEKEKDEKPQLSSTRTRAKRKKQFSVLRTPSAATTIEKTNMAREVARMATDEQTIALWRT